MLIALIAVNGPILAVFFIVSSNTLEHEVRAKKQAIFDANSKALSKPLWDYDFANLAKVAETIALDPDIALVEIFNDDNDIIASAPAGIGAGPGATLEESTAKLPKNTEFQHKEIFGTAGRKTTKVGALRIVYLADRIQAAVWNSLGMPVILFVTSTFAVLFAALFVNRIMIVRPLSELTVAIAATRRPGKRRRVDWHSPDEIGQVVYNFNDMQDRLKAEEEELRSAHKRVSNIYNNTPVMLYSVNSDDKIVGVSDYWMRSTGYEYLEVIGHHFKEFLSDESQAAYGNKQSPRLLTAGDESEVYCKFCKKDGSIIDVLISETADPDHDGQWHRSLSVMTDISALKHAEKEIRRRADTDTLTGLNNRACFSIDAEHAIAQAEDTNGRLAILFFDLDRFKWINDNLGHHLGDEVLKEVAKRISPLLSEADLFARLGGDEFAILLNGGDIENRATGLATRINSALGKPFELESRTINVTASVGISIYPDNGRSAQELLKASDVAMYSQKKGGRNGYSLFDEQMGLEAGRNLEVETFIADGIKNDWFELHFQPIVDLQTKTTVGFEGLLRLFHPTEGVLLPDEFIAVAEERGSILDIGDRVLDLGLNQMEALAQYPEFRDTYMSLNISAAQFLPGLPAKLAGLLMNRNIRPERLVLEITESVLMQQHPELASIFQNIRSLGCRFALDDFGTGYSSLSYLNQFPVDIVKIDRSFVGALGNGPDCEESQKSRALVQGIAMMAQELGMKIIAEGIETEQQSASLQEMNIEAGQGYHFGKPKPLANYLPDTVVLKVPTLRAHG